MNVGKDKYLEIIQPGMIAGLFVIHLYAFNIDEIRTLDDVLVSLVLCAAAGLVLSLVLALVFRNVGLSAFVASLAIVTFFAFYHLDDFLHQTYDGDGYESRHLAILWGALSLGALLAAIRYRDRLAAANRFIRMFTGVFVAVSIVQIVAYSLRNPVEPAAVSASGKPGEAAENIAYRPDIYYIILDGYARGDSMVLLGYDNSAFLSALEERGFFVADQSQANYCWTHLSMSATLNMQYLDFLTAQYGTGEASRDILDEMIDDNQVQRRLKWLGYEYVVTKAFAKHTNPAADIEIYYRGATYELDWFGGQQTVQLHATPFQVFLGQTTLLRPSLNEREHDDKVREMLYTFDHLMQLPQNEAPTFTYAHLLLPHHPWSMSPDDWPVEPGSPSVDGQILDEAVLEAEYAPYFDQVAFANRAIIAFIDEILASSPEPPIIIIQSDHGPKEFFYYEVPDKDRKVMEVSDLGENVPKMILPIFNAYYLPEGGDAELYPSISPVNSYRVVFDHYFGTDMGLLEDRSFCSQGRLSPYDFIEFPEGLP